MKNQNKGCLIIETRSLPNLIDTILNKHLKFIPKDWGVTLFLNKQMCSKFPKIDREVNLIVIEERRLSGVQYNQMITSLNFWSKIDYDKVLIFQSDSEILREGIEDFLHFDFIGAPLKHIDFPCMNGGLSLRSKQAMIDTIKSVVYSSQKGNEDIYFCNALKDSGYNLPTKEEAEKFSIETTFALGSLGIHAIDKWHSKEQCIKIRTQYDSGKV